MFDDANDEWGGPFEDGEDVHNVPGMTIGNLRDNALYVFDRYLSFRLKRAPGIKTEKDMEDCRHYLSVDETENIIREFNCQDDLPEGMYAIGASSVEELAHKTREIFNALLARIMSNLIHEGVNRGLIDCVFDSDSREFAFSPSAQGEQLAKKLATERKTKKKKKKDDSAD